MRIYLFCLSSLAVAAENTVIVADPQTAGMSMFRVHWDQPTPLAENGATGWWDMMADQKSKAYPAGGAYAIWTTEKRAGKPGAIAFDALNRSLLVRFPAAATTVAAQAKLGKALMKAELILPWKDDELLPPGVQDWGCGDGYQFNTGWGTIETWKKIAPRWHAVAWGLRRPWSANEMTGPTFNAAVQGSVYWTKYGAADEKTDRFPTRFGPVEVSSVAPEGHLDLTPLLTDKAFGATAADRLRTFADCGVLVRKQETYDHHFYTGVYEWPTATGGRAIKLATPRLVMTFSDAKKPDDFTNLAPAVDPAALPKSGVPTAVIPSEAELKALDAKLITKPTWMTDTQALRIQELFALGGGRLEGEALWTMFLPGHWLDAPRQVDWKDNKKILKPASHRDTFGLWVDSVINRPSRGWAGFEVGDQVAEMQLAEQVFPGPAKDAMRRYWSDWMMADRTTCPPSRIRDMMLQDGTLVHPMTDQLAKEGGGTSRVLEGDSYVQATGDWRGNKSFYRSGFCYDQSTQNFNVSSAVGATVFGGYVGADKAVADGRHGVDSWLLKGWIWNDGSGQEHLDHYYYGITLKGLKALQNAAPDSTMALIADSLVTKGVTEAIGAWHPNLKRFFGPSSRTSLEYLLGSQDGLQYLMHTMSKTGALTDLDDKLPNGMHAFGEELSPQLVALLSQHAPWVDADLAALVDAKPLPWYATHSHGGHWRRAYLGNHYGMASSQTLGGRIQAMAQWRRDDAPVTSARQLGTLDCRLGVNDTRWANDAPGWISSPGHQVVAQDRNRWLVLGSPACKADGLNGIDEKIAVTSVQQSLGLFDIRETGPTWEIWVGDQKIEKLPYALKAGTPVCIQDGVSFIAAIPLTDGQLRIGTKQTFDYHGKVDYQATVQIDSYIVRANQPLPKTTDWYALDQSFAGFAVELGDASERTFAAFRTHIAGLGAHSAYDKATRRVTATMGNETDLLHVVCETAPTRTKEGAWNAGHGLQLVTSTVAGKPLYPENGLLRDTPVEQLAFDHVEKGGAILHSAAAAGHVRLFLQSFAQGRRVVAWNPQGTPSDLRLTLADGGEVRSDGLMGLSRIALDRDRRSLDIQHRRSDAERLPDAPSEATAILVHKLDLSEIRVNGKAIKPVAVQINGKPWLAIALDATVPLRDPVLQQRMLNTLDTPRPAVPPAHLFMHWNVAGPFPNDDLAHGPELMPLAAFDAAQVWNTASNEGGDVRWINYGINGHTAAFGTGDVSQHAEVLTTFPSTVFQTTGKPCTYYLHARVRADRAQDLGLNLGTWSRRGAARRIDAWVGANRVPVFTASTGRTSLHTLVRVPLAAGENDLYLRISQNSDGVEWEQVSTVFGEPLFGLPLLTNVDVRTAEGAWIPACAKAP